jgi:hypothetical protein
MRFLAEELGRLLDPRDERDMVVVRAGLSLYRQEMVTVKESSSNSITAVVQDVVPHNVVLDLLLWPASTCSCESESDSDSDLICKHKLAVFFQSYSAIDSVNDWVIDWKNNRSKVEIPVRPANAVLKKAKDLDQSYEAWKTFTEEVFTETIEANIHSQPYILEDHIQTYFKKLNKKKPKAYNWGYLYQFMVYFFSMNLTIKLLEQNQQTIPTRSTKALHTFTDDLSGELHTLIHKLNAGSRPFSFDSFINDLVLDTNVLLEGGSLFEYEKIDVYRALWSHLFTKPALRKQEVERLSQKRADNESTAYLIASIHLFILNHQDDEAVLLLKRLSSRDCPYLFYWIREFSDTGTYPRALPFIEWFLLHVNHYIDSINHYYQASDFVRTFTRPITICCEQLKRMDLLEKFYRESLPYSYWNYSSFLFNQAQYKRWVDMLIYSNVSIDGVGQDMIKAVTAQNPELLLPLYHHAVQYTISQKNRSAYKTAVRYLKKMRTIYKKIKKDAIFNDYMSYIVQSTKRLRAFQEELQRGKLIDG